eukprot:GHVS01103233.1.p1 GENE.GHVS01103233.1~~GHVS01103233.1.p1  ORF type:complete len:1391 (+),score=130.82 GHVS01103233.1:123-4295(+)
MEAVSHGSVEMSKLKETEAPGKAERLMEEETALDGNISLEDPVIAEEPPVWWKRVLGLQPAPPKKRSTARQLLSGLGRRNWFFLVVGIVLSLVSGCVLPIFMILFGEVLDSAIGQSSNLDELVLIMTYVAIASFFLCTISVAFLEVFAERHVSKIRLQFFKSLTRQEMAFFDSNDAGTIAARFDTASVLVRNALGMKFSMVCLNCAMGIGGYVVSFIMNWLMTLVMLSGLPLMIVAAVILSRSLGVATRGGMAAYKEAGSVAEETFSLIRTVVAFGNEERMREKYESHLQKAEKAGVRAALFGGFGMGFLFFVMFLMYSLGFYYGGILIADSAQSVIDGNPATASPGQILTVFFGVLIGAFALGQMAPSLQSFLQGLEAASDLFEIIDRKSRIDPHSTEGANSSKPIVCDIKFNGVSFAFETRREKPVFTNLNLHIPAGKTVALVGCSGCGKSTIVQLLERYYDVDGGTITVDDIPIMNYNLSWWRSQVGIVSQEPRLFSLTIGENIKLGTSDETDKLKTGVRTSDSFNRGTDKRLDPRIIEAARGANAEGFINALPLQFETHVGVGGGQLSGGQKQRVAISRAIMRSPSLLILDEATSALDTESERIVQEALDRLIETGTARTTIIIAHRLSTIRKADKIVVLGKRDEETSGNDEESGSCAGSVVLEEGTHEELIQNTGGAYYQLVEKQKLNEENEAEPAETTDDSDGIQSSPSCISVMSSTGGVEHITEQPSIQEKKKPKTALCGLIKKKPKERSVSFGRLIANVRPEWHVFLLGLLAACLNGLVFPAFGIIFAKTLDVFYNNNPDYVRSKTEFWSIMFIVLATATLLINMFQYGCLEYCGQRIITRLRRLTFSSMVYQDMAFFDSPESNPGNLCKILSADITSVKGIIGNNIGAAIQALASLVAGLVIAFINSPQLAAVMLCAFLVLVPCNAMQEKVMHEQPKANVENTETGSDVNSPAKVLNETITGMRTVAAFGLEKTVFEMFQESVMLKTKSGIRDGILLGVFWGLSQGLQYGANALALWYGGIMMKHYGLSAEAMLMTIFALMFAASGSGQATMYATDSKKGKVAALTVYDAIDKVPSIDSRNSDGTVLENMRGEVEVNHINFRYPQRPTVPVYRRLKFRMEQGTTVALVGTSGCGKSTMVNLLERFYDIEGSYRRKQTTVEMEPQQSTPPATGSITIDGVDIRDMNLRFLRSQIALVSQEPLLFNISVAENVRVGKSDATQEEIEEACKVSNSHSFIMNMPQGYSTVVGKSGSKLSGGQKQRIAIARAIIRNPKILLLDEATSALDSESEQIVQKALDDLLAAQKRTTLIIAHRLKTIADSDGIFVLDTTKTKEPSAVVCGEKHSAVVCGGSRVVEQGTHQQLLRQKGVYCNLVELSHAPGT